MAEEFLEEIYREAALRTELKCLLEQLMSGSDGEARRNYPQLIRTLEQISIKYAAVDPKDGAELRSSLQKLQEYNGKYMELADFIESNILPKYEKYLSRLSKICVEDEQGLCLESSQYGFLTVRNTESGQYFHSKNDPMWEARQIAGRIYDPAMKSYSLLGCGLGYIAYQLYIMSDGSVPINMYEYDEKMIQYARRYGVLDWIPEECLSITVDADVLPFLYSLEREEGHGYHIFEPELYRVPEDAGEIIRTLIINGNTATGRKEIMQRNFYRNLQSDARPLSCFHWDKQGGQFIIVAGGPSVDDGLDFLRRQKGHMPVVAVGTILSKLLAYGITPDMAVILESRPAVMRQLEGITDYRVPLFLGVTAYWKLARSYKGEKYLVPTDGDTPEERYYAERCGGIALECPGTVTILAVSLALYFGAEEIYLLGADFAFPKERYYAAGAIGGGTLEDKNSLFSVESVGGGLVYADKPMIMFRNNMEELIENTPEVTFYNLSNGGARIAGTIELRHGGGQHEI